MSIVLRFALLTLLAWLVVAPAAAEPCRSETYRDNDYIICSFDLTKTDLRLYWRKADGTPFATFDALADQLKSAGDTLQFAMNGGMFDDAYKPIGLYVEGGKELAPINTARPPSHLKQVPNFLKKPNGVFYLASTGAGVATTEAFIAARPDAVFATQSGPMLVIDGAIHKAFIPGSTDLKPRNGVGVASPTMVHFAISEGSVNFYDFALLFRDRLGCRSALFLDGGSASGLYAPELERNDPPGHGGYGPIIAAVAKKQ
jgi:uncharacterized protein YigE (DUF2233 family)